MATVLRPLTVGELLDRTFQLYRQNFVVFVGIVAIPHLLSLGLSLALQSSVLTRPAAPAVVTPFANGAAWFLVSALVTLAVATLAQAATVVAVSRVYLEQPVSIAEAYGRVKGRIPELCFISLAMGFLIGLGMLALIIPGVLLALRWSLIVPVAVLEQVGLRQAMSRSADLTEGHRGRLLVLYFLYFVLAAMFSSLWQVPIMVAGFASAVARSQAPAWVTVAVQVGGFFTACLVGPLLTIAVSLVYYDERVRKEAFDVEHLLAQLDGPSDQPVAVV